MGRGWGSQVPEDLWSLGKRFGEQQPLTGPLTGESGNHTLIDGTQLFHVTTRRPQAQRHIPCPQGACNQATGHGELTVTRSHISSTSPSASTGSAAT